MFKEISIEELKEGYIKEFNEEPQYFYSAPGRTELSGNHTDHQHGKVLAAAIDLDIRAAVNPNNTNDIVIKSEGYDLFKVSLSDLRAKEDEAGTSISLVRGVAARFKELGHDVKGFNAYIKSNVFSGSGLSSSAAFEVLIGTIINDLNNINVSPIEVAKISQYSENNYFMKPSGLMDQMASAIGSCVYIDFKDNDDPIIEKIEYDFAKSGYTLCIVDSGADHSNLTHEYAYITDDLKKVCSMFNKKWLREVDEKEFYSRIEEVNKQCGERATKRAIHVFSENRRVDEQVLALKNNNFQKYLSLMNESGLSSWNNLQNVIPSSNPNNQDLANAIRECSKILGQNGVCRVHGGGFAGTLQAFVKNDYVDEFKKSVESILGKDSCHILHISPFGGHRIK